VAPGLDSFQPAFKNARVLACFGNPFGADMKRNAKLGFTLIEMALVLGIVGLVMGGIFAAWGAVSSQNKLRSSEEQISLLLGQIRNVYGNRSELETATGDAFTNALIQAGLVSESWVDGNVIRNPYGGNVVLAPDSSTGGATQDGINITLSNLARSDCLRLANEILGIARREGLYKIGAVAVNDTTVYNNITSACPAPGPVTIGFFFKLKPGD
jgi:prepilin-type N-terminal cleavage/methylation domain-containing protein